MSYEQFREQCATAGDDIITAVDDDFFIEGTRFSEGVKFGRESLKQRIRALPLPEVAQELDTWKLFRQAMYLRTYRTCAQYLMSNAHGRWDGSAKAYNHQELCKDFIAAVKGCDPDIVRRNYEAEYQSVHTETQKLTDNLDSEIGFPTDSRPDYDDLEPKFFSRFFDLAMSALNVHPPVASDAEALRKENESFKSAMSKRGYVMSESTLGTYRLIIGFETLVDTIEAHSVIAALKKGGTNEQGN